MQTDEKTDRHNEESSRFFKKFRKHLKNVLCTSIYPICQNIPVHSRDRINTGCSLHRLFQQSSFKE